MPVIALYEFDDSDFHVRDTAVADGAQDGLYLNGAHAADGLLHLDGEQAVAKILIDPAFQLDRGTLAIEFTQTAHVGDGPNTIVSRDRDGLEEGGGFRIEVTADGAIVVSHETDSDTVVFTTGPGFFAPGDQIELSYSWDHGGSEPGRLVIDNHTTGADFSADVPNTLTMDMGGQNPHWIVGAGQASGDPADPLSGFDQHFNGTSTYMSISDSKDNIGNQPPVANPDVAETDEDTPVVIDVLGNDEDPDGDPLTVTGGTAEHGTVTVNPDGTITYTPDPDYNGPDEITYTIDDGNGGTATGTVTITVNPVNDDPVANDDSVTTGFNTPVVVDVLANDTDVDGDDLSVLGTPTSADGTVVVNPDGTITFTPNPGFTGVAVVDYEITDGNGGTDTAQVFITVTDNNPPVANPDVAETDEDTPVVIDVLGNDEDPDGDPLTVTGGTAEHGTVTVNPDGTLTYTPDPDYNGPDEITYTIDDGNGGTATGTVTITVHPVNDDPVANDDHATTAFNAPITIPVLANDTDVDGDDLSILGTPTSEDGTVTVNSDGSLTFTPNPGFIGTAVVDYQITDGNGGTDSAQVFITVNPPGTGRDGIVWGTDGGDLIDVNYTGDNDGDFIDNDDALLPGAVGNDDFVVAGAGDDTVLAGLGDDIVYGGTGNDLVFGGDGNDTLFGEAGDDTLHGDDGDDLLDGGAGDDVLYGGDGDDTLLGGDGNDELHAGPGNDLLVGGRGNDTLIGGDGADTMLGGDDRDLFLNVGPGDYIDGGEGGDDWDTLDLRGSGPLRVTFDDDNPENGIITFLDEDGNPTGTTRFINIENVIPCFTPGTLIATPRGEIPVEALRPGDRVITRDNGIQEVRWTGHRDMGAGDFAAAPHLAPILIRKGSLGNGLPERDMMVSPNHRVLVANDRTALYFDEHEVLVAAKHLVGAEGIAAIRSSGTSYIHFMCDRHEVVLSDGAWTETFQPGDQTLKGMGNAQRTEIFELFPELKQPEGIDAYAAARKTLKRHEALLLVK